MPTDGPRMPDAKQPPHRYPAPEGVGAEGRRVLAVGLTAADVAACPDGPVRNCVFVRFRQMTPELIAVAAPDIVLAPLFGPDFDILDIADALAAAAFAGRLVALAAPLPRPDAVRSEVLAHAPGLSFELVMVEEGAGHRG